MNFAAPASAYETFGPYESRIIFDGGKDSVSYRMVNTGKLTWLVQAWVEDMAEKKTNAFIVAPMLYRVEPSSQYTSRIIKKEQVKEDIESVFWVVSNSLPGGEKVKEHSPGDKDAKLNLAFRYKVPLFYRPNSLKNIPQQPESLQWNVNNQGKIKVYNPTKFSAQLQYISIDGKRSEGKGISYIIPPLTGAEINAKGKRGDSIKYGVINDYGATKEYTGSIG